MRLTDDERILLTAFATAEPPIGLHEAMQRIMPPRPDGPGQWGQQWWGRQFCATLRDFMDLRKARMLDHLVVDGRQVNRYVLTDKGSAALADAKGQT